MWGRECVSKCFQRQILTSTDQPHLVRKTKYKMTVDGIQLVAIEADDDEDIGRSEQAQKPCEDLDKPNHRDGKRARITNHKQTPNMFQPNAVKHETYDGTAKRRPGVRLRKLLIKQELQSMKPPVVRKQKRKRKSKPKPHDQLKHLNPHLVAMPENTFQKN